MSKEEFRCFIENGNAVILPMLTEQSEPVETLEGSRVRLYDEAGCFFCRVCLERVQRAAGTGEDVFTKKKKINRHMEAATWSTCRE